MAGITLAQAETQLAAWIEADAAVANSQSYSVGGRSLSRADAEEITKKIQFWSWQVSRLNNNNGALTVRRAVPRDN